MLNHKLNKSSQQPLQSRKKKMGLGDTIMLNPPTTETGKSAETRVSGMATNAEHSASVISIKTNGANPLALQVMQVPQLVFPANNHVYNSLIKQSHSQSSKFAPENFGTQVVINQQSRNSAFSLNNYHKNRKVASTTLGISSNLKNSCSSTAA